MQDRRRHSLIAAPKSCSLGVRLPVFPAQTQAIVKNFQRSFTLRYQSDISVSAQAYSACQREANIPVRMRRHRLTEASVLGQRQRQTCGIRERHLAATVNGYHITAFVPHD